MKKNYVAGAVCMAACLILSGLLVPFTAFADEGYLLDSTSEGAVIEEAVVEKAISALETPGTYKVSNVPWPLDIMETMDVEVFYYLDDFEGTIHSFDAYCYYSNLGVRSNGTHEVDQAYQEDGVDFISWKRPLLNIEHDKNYYQKISKDYGDGKVGTFVVKSDQRLEDSSWLFDEQRLKAKPYNPIQSGKAIAFTKKSNPSQWFVDEIDKSGRTEVLEQSLETLGYSSGISAFNEKTEQYYLDFLTGDRQWGIYRFTPKDSIRSIEVIEKYIQREYDILLTYMCFEDDFPIDFLNLAKEKEKTVELTLQTSNFDGGNPETLYDIINGEYDEVLIGYADQLKAFEDPVLFRLNNEMNGDWCNYSAFYTSLDPEIYRASWIYIFELFDDYGVENCIWVWNPHDNTFPDFQWSYYANYYPGDDYVDMVGMTGYNTGNYYPAEVWREFGDIYKDLYEEYLAVFTKPLLITEFAASTCGGDRKAWVGDMLDQIDDYENIKAVIWFSGIDMDSQGNPARIYDLYGDYGVLDEFKAYFKDDEN